ncbi:unconventional myosin-XVIIIa isoform X3 [Topomyia yanbarensis]|uniref:unconventional myosin-XVIIIa isoform X3 n=1 Tax=Topomyia yanbarensis TaxID=2498891 RepID=UPI00273B46A3|nr:unconventional myosin-XVIIIa isoform X3 [Topomyia yanbarensis]XP_058832509.1 unconventional myosin-XVIIIa isoform X3 [Topomyia yanbarensis]XP_058832510.1 unconventional myosin-XVIIIa isoform X3 [Topomyia yanbarensis]
MSVNQFQRSFEQSLRSSYNSGPVIATSVITPLKKEIHRGCTGKAHACGTLKTIRHTPVIERPFRKGSFSSDTISDTSSDISQSNQSPAVETKPPSRKLRLFSSFRRKTTDNLPSPDEINRNSKSLRIRGRLYSDGDKSSDGKKQSSDQTVGPINGTPPPKNTNLQHSQSFHLYNRRSRDCPASPLLTVRSKDHLSTTSNGAPTSNGIGSNKTNGTLLKPALQRRSSNPNDAANQNGGSGRSSSISIANPATNGGGTTTAASGGGINRGLRNSFRHKQNVVQWNNIWEQSFSVKPSGGTYKTYDKLLASKIKSNQLHDTDRENGHESSEKVWLIHRGGFTAASKLPHSISSEPGKTMLQLEHNGEELSVDDDDIEQANPETLDLVEDICQLRHLNEASMLHVLRQRYASNLIHTRAGPVLLVVNPMAPLSLYSEKVVSMFRGCKTEDMPPHVFSLAQTAYRAMLETRRDQSLIFMGRSGSGKTTSFKHALYYLALAAGSANKILSAERVSAMNTILEAFGNAKTCLNSNATRFTQILSLDFDHCGQIASASVQILLLEKSRAGRRTASDQHNFHVFGRLLAGAEGHLQKELFLDTINFDESNLFVTLPTKLEDKQNASIDFARLQQAFSMLNVDQSAVRACWYVLAAIYHLGTANCSIVGTGLNARVQFANPTAARKAASLLGISLDDLTTAAFSNALKSNPASPVKSALFSEQPDLASSALDSLEGFVIGLYSEVMAAAVALVNKAIGTSSNTIASILLIDTPGFQNPASCGQQIGATLSDLRHNYLQERLQLLFHHITLVVPRNRYAQELVEIDTGILHDTNPGPLVNLLDKAPQNHVVRTSQNNLRDQDKRGLLWMLDEEIMYPNASDDTFFERLFSCYGDRESQSYIRRGAGTRQFILQHMQGTNPVLYSSTGWLKGSHEHGSTKCAISLLQDSTKTEISSLFTSGFTRSGGTVYFGSIVGTEGTQSLRRVSSIRRSFTSAGIKRNSVMLQVKFTVDGIIDTLRRTGTHFVHCYLLQHNAGTTNYINLNTKALHTDDIVNVPLLRSQLRGSQILDFSRLHRLGFPMGMPLSEFTRRFGLLADGTLGDITVENILNHNEIDPSVYRIGPSQVLFRSGVLNQLEAKRDELLSGRIIQLQAYCRGHLARKRLAQRRVQELAVKCIQRNVRAFLKVREWAWWRLLVRVTPLLNVHRTEEQLKIATTELQVLKAKLDKVESERNNLKTENSKLELRLSDMTAELAEEHSSSNVISERLDAETTERLRLEKEVKEHETKYRNLQESSEKLEMELLCAKSDLNGDLDDDLEGDDAGSNAYRLKYERVARELEFTKKRLQTQHEHDLEQLIGLKKQLEKKLADAYEEVEEQRQVVGQWKRKAQKMTNEMNDLRMLLEEQNSRNNLLEKRQRKFDSECQALQDSARQEKQAKERLTREKDVLIAEKFTIEQTLSDVRLELELKEEKYSALQRELDEMTFGGGTEEEIAQLKRQKMELDRRCKEQEEELDEMAGQIQLLEQAKLRLEMSLETMRKGARKESQQRDEELEEVRGSSYKKIKTLECQLEQEHEERTLLLREKHELERRLNNLEEHDRSERAAEEAASQKLKRDLRKYKALLRDAQTQLERAKADSAGKALIRQLRNQLEDAESARSAAVKARQAAEGELQDVQLMLEEAQRARYDAEDKATSAQRDRTELQAQIDENEEEMAELMKKYSSTVKQLSSEQTIIADNEFKISELESEKKSLKEQIFELTSRLENVENIGDSSSSIQFKRLELRTKEIESRLELEQANRARTEVQLQRHKDSLEKAQHEVSQTRTKEMHAQEALKKSQKTIRELREELHIIANKEQESLAKRKDLEKRLESVEAEAASARADLRLALQRIADLQQAMEEGDSYHSDSENSDSSIDSVGEMSYRSPSSVTLRARSGQSNGTSTNGSSTTLCIREEKENTPRIRPKFNLIGLRRRRLPFTIHEEDEDESALTTTLGKAENDVSDGIDNCIESIKRTIGDGSESGLEQSAGPSSTLTDSPKYTGAIKKTINITVKSLKCNEPQKKSQSSLNEMRTKVDGESNNVSSKMCTDANNNLSENVFSKHVQSISDPNVASDLMDTSVVLANQIQNDSRFDLDALKSIKEKIKNLNRSLKEEAAQERCSRFEFPPLSTKPDVLVTEEPSINKDVTKLDQLEAQLNLDGIRSMKEKIQNLKKKLQEDSTSTMTANKEDIINEISEMKKALTVAFLNKGCERRSLSRSSSERDDSSTSSFKREDNSLHSLKSDQNSSSSLKSVDSSNLDLKQAKELTKPPAVNKLAPAHEEINNLSPTSYSGSMDSGPMRVSSLNQVSNSEIKRDPFAFATIDNVVERKLMVIGNDQSATVHNSPSTISCAVNKVLLEVDSSDEALKIESAIQPEADSRYIISADYNPVNDDINVRSKNDEPNVKTTTEGKCTMEAELHQLDINIISERNVGKSTINTIIEDTDSPQSQSTIFSNATLPFESAQRNDLLNSMMVHRMPIVSPLQSIVLENKLENTQLNSSFELELVKQIDVYDQNLIIDEHTQESEKVFPINQEEYIDDTTTESIGVVERHQHEVVKDGESLTNPEKNVSYKCDEPSDVESPYSTDIVERMESTDKEHLQVQTNSCFKTKDCRCENIDQTIEMLVTSMEQSSPSQSLSKPCIQSSIDMNSDTNDDIKSTMTTLSEDIDILPNINLTSADKHLADMTILTPVSTIDVSEQYTPVSLSNIDGNNNETNWIANSENEYIDPEENTKSNQTSQQATLTEFVAKNNIFSDLANGDFVETTTLQTPHKKVDESSLPINDPIEDIPNQVSERALAIDSSVLLNECSSRSVIPLHAIVVSTDVMTDTLVSTPASSSSKSGNLGQQQKPLSYAESLKKARSPPKSCPQHMTRSSALAEAKQACKTEPAAKTNRKPQHQSIHQRERHSSLARGGNNPSKDIRQSKSASKLNSKEISLPNGKPTELKQSKSVAQEQQNISLARKKNNRSNPNLLVDKKFSISNNGNGIKLEQPERNRHRTQAVNNKKK